MLGFAGGSSYQRIQPDPANSLIAMDRDRLAGRSSCNFRHDPSHNENCRADAGELGATAGPGPGAVAFQWVRRPQWSETGLGARLAKHFAGPAAGTTIDGV